MNPLANLCIITEHFHPDLFGAPERYLRYIPGLIEKDINVEVFTIWREGLDTQEILNGALVHRLVLPTSHLCPSAELASQTFQYFQLSEKWPDIVHILTHSLQGVKFLWQMRLHGIVCIHSITMDPYRRATSAFGRIKFWLHQWIRYSVFSQIVVSSKVIASSAQRCGISSRHIKIIPNGVDLKRFHPLENTKKIQSLRQQLGFGEHEMIVLFVGFIIHRKGIDLLLKAWSYLYQKHPTSKLVLIGPKTGKEQASQGYEFMASDLAASQIVYLEPVLNIELYMQIADIFVFPSRLEGFGNVVLEAMACGLPCVLTPFKGLPECFGEAGKHYILSSFEPEHISNDISNLLENSDQRQRISQNCLLNVKNGLDIVKAIDLHAEMYLQLLSFHSRKI